MRQIFALAILLAFSAAEAKSIDASCHENFDGLTVEELLSRAESGDGSAYYDLGRYYEYGICVSQDDTTAIEYYQAAAQQEYAAGSYRLGVLFDNGWGVPENKTKAFEYYGAAAQKNHALAQHDLALMYFKGTGTRKNRIKAFKWISVAVSSGNEIMRDQMIRIGSQLTLQEKNAAEQLAMNWRQKFYDGEAEPNGI